MEPEVDDLSVRKPVGAVLSVRVPGEVAAAVDEYAAQLEKYVLDHPGQWRGWHTL